MVMDRKEYYWSFGGKLLLLVLVGVVAYLLFWGGNNETKEAVMKTSADTIGAVNGVGTKIDGLSKTVETGTTATTSLNTSIGKTNEKLERVATAFEKACEKNKNEKSSIPASSPPAAVTPAADAPKFPVQYHIGQLGNEKTEIADRAMDEIMASGGEDAAQELIKLLQSPNKGGEKEGLLRPGGYRSESRKTPHRDVGNG